MEFLFQQILLFLSVHQTKRSVTFVLKYHLKTDLYPSTFLHSLFHGNLTPFLSTYETKGVWHLSSSIISKLTCVHPPSYTYTVSLRKNLTKSTSKLGVYACTHWQWRCRCQRHNWWATQSLEVRDICLPASSQNWHVSIHLLTLTLSPSAKIWQNQHQH